MAGRSPPFRLIASSASRRAGTLCQDWLRFLVIVVRSLHYFGTSVDSLLETLAELHRHGVKLVVRDHAHAVETGGLLAAANLLVEARRP